MNSKHPKYIVNIGGCDLEAHLFGNTPWSSKILWDKPYKTWTEQSDWGDGILIIVACHELKLECGHKVKAL